MNNNELSIEVWQVIDKLAQSEISSQIDTSLTPPDPFCGADKIRLIILCQDPTVKDCKRQGLLQDDILD